MNSKKGKPRVSTVRRTRTAEDRARDRAINEAIAAGVDRKGPIIVRVEKKKETPPKPKPTAPSSNRAPKSKRSKRAKAHSESTPARSSALADALIAAGVKTQRKPASKVTNDPKNVSKPKRKVAPKRTVENKAQTRKKTKKQPKTKGTKGKPHSPPKHKAKSRQKFAARMQKLVGAPQEKSPVELVWEQRQKEISSLIENIRRRPFEVLANAWKKHVAYVGYIEKTGRNQDRRAIYMQLVTAIEQEWGRRSKLSFNSEDYFDWPSTRAGRRKHGVGEIDWVPEGFLSYLGYHVGESSNLRDHERHAILRRTFKMVLPPLESREYVKSWGPPSSPARLKKMADSIASFARSAKHRSASSFALAISEWEADLKMLREEFYVGKFGFGWPQI